MAKLWQAFTKEKENNKSEEVMKKSWETRFLGQINKP